MIQFWIETKNKKKMKDAFGWLTGPNDWYVDPRNFEPEYKKIGKEGFAEITNNAWGFDSCFLIAGAKNLDSTENELEVKSEKKGDFCVDSVSFRRKRLVHASLSTDLLIGLPKLLFFKGKKIKLFFLKPLTFATVCSSLVVY